MEKAFFVAIVGGGHCGKSNFARTLRDLIESRLGPGNVELIAESQYLETISGPADSKEYNYTRLAEDLAAIKNKVVIIEGFYLLSRPETRHKFDQSVFIELTDEERFKRKLKDLSDKASSALDVYKEFHGLDKPLYDRFIAPSKIYAKKVIGSGNYLRELNKFAEYILDQL